jgi:uncharacterized surface protein with fasciclin (FAS1) repeats
LKLVDETARFSPVTQSRAREPFKMTNLRKTLLTGIAAVIATASLGLTNVAYANPTVGGAAMFENKNIIENAVKSPVHKTLVAAVQAAGLVDVLQTAGPFTVFAPVDKAFAKLPAGTVDTLLKPENKDTLVKVLTAHVVAGDLTSATLKKRITANGGSYNMKTVSGDTITAKMSGKAIMIFDESGGSATITTADVDQSNGEIHVINRVLLPK